MCSPPSVGSIIFKVVHMQNLEIGPFLTLQFDRKSAFLEHPRHFKMIKIRWKNVYFCLWPFLGVHFVCHLLFHFCLHCSTLPFRQHFSRFLRKVLPALSGKHSFESCLDAKSSKKSLLALPFRWKSAILDPQLARGSLHNPWEKSKFALQKMREKKARSSFFLSHLL